MPNGLLVEPIAEALIFGVRAAGEIADQVDIIFGQVTNIKRWTNSTDEDVEVWKTDHSGGRTREDYCAIPAGETRNKDMWVPWATSSSEYAGKHATVRIGGQDRFFIWQQEGYVRFNTFDAFIAHGPAIPGFPVTRGNRSFLIRKYDNHYGIAIGGLPR